jgi:DNA replication protein DnaC
MESNNFTRSSALNNIPAKKLQDAITTIQQNKEFNLEVQATWITALNRYAESNIPIEYWSLNMKDFTGDTRLQQKYEEYVKDIKQSYLSGKSLCLAGQHGVGKTFVSTSILKKACHKGYSCLYSDLSNVVSVLTTASSEDKFLSRKELCMVDFLVIDEVDPRFIATDNASDLFARSLESVFRTRSANKLPTIICTNSPNIVESFKGSLKVSLDSLFSGYMEIFIVMGEDFRKRSE